MLDSSDQRHIPLIELCNQYKDSNMPGAKAILK